MKKLFLFIREHIDVVLQFSALVLPICVFNETVAIVMFCIYVFMYLLVYYGKLSGWDKGE